MTKVYLVKYGVKESNMGMVVSSYISKTISSREKLFGTKEKAQEYVNEITEAMKTLYGLANWDFPTITEMELE